MTVSWYEDTYAGFECPVLCVLRLVDAKPRTLKASKVLGRAKGPLRPVVETRLSLAYMGLA